MLNAALSGDGSTVAYAIVDSTNDVRSVGVMPFNGGAGRTLLDSAQRLPVADGGIPDGGDRMQLSRDGAQLLLGSSGVLAGTASGELHAPAVPVAGFVLSTAPLVGDGLYQATMAEDASRVLYLSGDANGVPQLARLDLSSTGQDQPLMLSEAGIDPAFVLIDGASAATVEVRVQTSLVLSGIGAAVLRGGLADPNVGSYALLDDGAHGDGVFASNAVHADCCAAAGPRTVRAQAEATSSDGHRVAAAVEMAGFAVETAAATATP